MRIARLDTRPFARAPHHDAGHDGTHLTQQTDNAPPGSDIMKNVEQYERAYVAPWSS